MKDKIYTTLKQIKENSPPRHDWKKLVKNLGALENMAKTRL